MNRTLWELQDVLDAINGEGAWKPKKGKLASSLGNIQAIALRLDVARDTIYRYQKRWKAVRDAIREQKELRKDLIEDKMFSRAMKGSDIMLMFFANNQMRDRGYGQGNRLEIDASDRFEKLLRELKNGTVARSDPKE